MKLVKWMLFVVLLAFLLNSCTSSRWLVSVLYERMDNILARETKEYAEFTNAQKVEIDRLADEYHLWHRTQHLPQYVELLREIETRVRSEQVASADEITGWANQIEGFAREMGECYPLDERALPLIKTLTDEQVEQILAHGKEEYDEFYEERFALSEEKRVRMRYKESVRWLDRVELDLNSEQKTALMEAIKTEKTLTEDDRMLWWQWHQAFVETLTRRDTPGFEKEMISQIQSLWAIQDDNFPEIVEFNRELWLEFFTSLAQTQSEHQRNEFADWLAKMASNLDGISTAVSGRVIVSDDAPCAVRSIVSS